MKDRETIKLLMEFGRLHRSHVQEIMESEGLFYGQLPILEVVNHLGCCTQKEIANSLGISRSYVSRIEKRALTKLYLKLKE